MAAPAERTYPSRLMAFAATAAIHIVVISAILHTALTSQAGSAADSHFTGTVEVSLFPSPSASRPIQPNSGAPSAPSPVQEASGPVSKPAGGSSASSPNLLSLANPSIASTQDGIVIGDSEPPDEASGFRVLLRDYISRHKSYPEAGRVHRLHGQVEVRFLLARNGTVSLLKITRSSGFPILDGAAIQTIERAAPLPAIPSNMPDTLEIELPIVFDIPS